MRKVVIKITLLADDEFVEEKEFKDKLKEFKKEFEEEAMQEPMVKSAKVKVFYNQSPKINHNENQ